MMDLTKAEFASANERSKAKQVNCPLATAVRYEPHPLRVLIMLSSGVELSVAATEVPGMEGARAEDLADAEISPSGLGIHFPKLDVDLYVPALL
ncbi:MAG: DUF2442 domain-containing protein [Massilia sp.]